MKNISLIIFSTFYILFLNSCGGFSDAKKVLTNEKIKTTDEFLVKKREPLTLPPDFTKIPEPGTIEKDKRDKSQIETILKIPQEKKKNNNITSNVEKVIINEIKN